MWVMWVQFTKVSTANKSLCGLSGTPITPFKMGLRVDREAVGFHLNTPGDARGKSQRRRVMRGGIRRARIANRQKAVKTLSINLPEGCFAF